MGVVDMSNPPNTNPGKGRHLFSSPALSLSLAGIFRDAGGEDAPATDEREEVERGNEVAAGGGVGGRRVEETVEISSENSGPARSRSDDDEADAGGGGEEQEDDTDDDKNKRKKRKRYHRHTAEQIREMEALFKESPHPDEKQRQELSKQLGLHPRQVKFWFQNRRTQIKAIQERHENSLLKTEIEKLRDETKGLRDSIKKVCCPNCGFVSSGGGGDGGKDVAIITQDQQHLRMENARLKAEVERLRAAVGKHPPGTSPTSSSCSAGYELENKISSEFYSGVLGLDKSGITKMVKSAVEELKRMATAGEPLWIRSYETGREILNYDVYMKEFPLQNSGAGWRTKRSIEASRETGLVFVDLPRLVQTFMDVNLWKEMFTCMVSKATTLDVLCSGEGVNRDGAIQLMFAELQMLTPMVATREAYFVRCCKQLRADVWAVVDVSVDKVKDNIDASMIKCRRRPSGCIIEDKSNGHCKVTWVEHMECQKSMTVHGMYRAIVNSGLAFGAKHWMATLQLQCERLVFFMATNVPTKDSIGVSTLAGRKSILKLAQRMTSSFCRAVGASSYHAWNKIPSKTGDEIRLASRKNLNDPGEPLGVILCAVSSLWLPVSQHVLFHFLRDENHRHKWDIISNGTPVQSIANLAKGQDRGNSVTLQTTKSKDNNMWLLQDSCTNGYESMVVYAPVDIAGMQSVMTGCDSGHIAILPSGFSILSDGIESRPLVISSAAAAAAAEEKSTEEEGGSLLTIAFQILTSNCPTAKPSMESVESVNSLISRTLRSIKTSLNCDDDG